MRYEVDNNTVKFDELVSGVASAHLLNRHDEKPWAVKLNGVSGRWEQVQANRTINLPTHIMDFLKRGGNNDANVALRSRALLVFYNGAKLRPRLANNESTARHDYWINRTAGTIEFPVGFGLNATDIIEFVLLGEANLNFAGSFYMKHVGTAIADNAVLPNSQRQDYVSEAEFANAILLFINGALANPKTDFAVRVNQIVMKQAIDVSDTVEVLYLKRDITRPRRRFKTTLIGNDTMTLPTSNDIRFKGI